MTLRPIAPLDEKIGPGSRVLLVGSSGFIGSAVADALASLSVPTTHLVRRLGARTSGNMLGGNLEDISSLTRACAGHDVVIHAASYIGDDPVRQKEVNARGTANLVRAAEVAGVKRILYISTASVYGGNAKNGSVEKENEVRPRSTLNLSRVEAEKAVLGSGGVVVRPHLVYGRGDRFFLGPLVAAMSALDGWIEHGSAEVSIISSEALARATVQLGIAAPTDFCGQIFHAAHPQRTSIFTLVSELLSRLDRHAPAHSYAAGEARAKLRESPASASQIEMVTMSRWYDSSLIWRSVDVSPGPAIDISNQSLRWYEMYLSRAVAGW